MNEYAPEYTRKERIVIALKMAAWVIPIFLVAKLWLFDWLSEFSAHANCYQYGNINGVHVLFYGVFVFMPLTMALVIFFIEGLRSIKIMKMGQNPLPGEKVLKPTKYKYGAAAKIQPLLILTVILLSIGMSIWGSFQAHALTQDIKPCESTLQGNEGRP